MTDWAHQLAKAENYLGHGRSMDAFCAAFGALELCFDRVAHEFASADDIRRDDRFGRFAAMLRDGGLLRHDEFQLARHLGDARNIVVHKFGFEPSLDEVRRTIERVRQLCGKFARKVSDAMTKPVITTTPDAAIAAHIPHFVRDGVSLIPVVEGKKVVGTLTESAILEIWQREGGILDTSTPVRDLMSKEVIPDIQANATVEAARKLMLKKRLPALLILHGGLPVGILTKYDLLNHVTTLL